MSTELTAQAQNNIEEMCNTTYIPSIKITYGVSPHFLEGKAKLGDFFLDDQSLSPKLKVVVVGYRYQAMAITKSTKEFVENIICPEGDKPFRQRKEYIDFVAKHQKEGNDVTDGIDVMLFLPDYNVFGSFFGKKKTLSGVIKMLSLGGQGKVTHLETIKKEWRKFSWYELLVTDTGETISTIPHMEEKLLIYNSQAEEIQDDSKDTGRAR